MTTSTSRQTWQNWYGNVTARPLEIIHPTSEEQVSEIVAAAAAQGRRVKAVGSGHSNVPVATSEGTMLNLSNMSGLIDADPTAGTATFLAGTVVSAVGPALWERGLSLANQGDINSQQLGGCVATGTHGTGITLSSFSGELRSARVVSPDGSLLDVNESTPDLLRAVRTNVGVLGVVTQITTRVVPAFCLRLATQVVGWEALTESWDELLKNNRHFTFYWCPKGENPWAPLPDAVLGQECVIVKTMNPEPAEHPAEGEKFVTDFVDRAYRVWPDPYAPDFHEFEYMVPLEHSRSAVSEVRDLLRRSYPDEPFPLEIRFTGADDAWLSPFSDQPSCVLSVSGRMGVENTAFFRDFDQLLEPYGPRSHWGKWHEQTPERLAAVYPHYESFCDLRRGFDPAGIFLNDHTTAMFTT